jgi:hypothetical protein
MCKKIAIYVEGQTEHVFINHCILTWWEYSGVKITNIKLVNDLKNPIPDFISENYGTHFVILNVEGLGSLVSAIFENAHQQVQEGFEIIGLRDLEIDNYDEELRYVIEYPVALKKKLKNLGYLHSDEFVLYFAIIKVEAWLLAFTEAVAKWAKISEKDVQICIKKYSEPCLEKIRDPQKLLNSIGNRGKDTKKFHEIKSLVSGIRLEAIQNVYQTRIVPNFSLFWHRLVSHSRSP